MNIKDFQGIYKWKFLIPFIYIMSWSLMIFGPIFFPYGYQIFCIIIVVYSLLKALGLTFGALVALIKFYSSVKNLRKEKHNNPIYSTNKFDTGQPSYYHAIIIPSYKEQEEVLLQTLSVLSQSNRSKYQFMVFLAMQAHEKGAKQKAEQIIKKSQQMFFHMSYSLHQVQELQAKGKASNVNWCVQHVKQMLPNNIQSTDQIILTIIDADSWAPAQYFDQIEVKLRQRPQIKDSCMFAAPQIFTRNHLEVPIFNRLYDQMHSLVHLANIVAIHYSFPLSNYSISYNLSKKITWWDTCADAIGEDFHTCQKCYWKLKQQTFHTIPIYIPFNQLSLSTGQGYVSDLKARFWQAERHTLGVSDVAYCWNMLFKTRFKIRNFILTLLVTQVFSMSAVIPWSLLALGIQYKLVNNPAIHFFQMWVIDLLLNLTPAFSVSSYIFYEWWKRISQNKIYKQKCDKWWRVLEYPILFMIPLFLYSIPAFLIASFAVLCTVTEYRVAEKRIQKKTPNTEQNIVNQKVEDKQKKPSRVMIQEQIPQDPEWKEPSDKQKTENLSVKYLSNIENDMTSTNQPIPSAAQLKCEDI